MTYNAGAGVPWPIDVLTLDYLISGDVDLPAQKWGWSYFCVYEKTPARSLDVRVTANISTSGLPALAWTGATASFAFGTGLVAIIPRGPAAIAVWDEWKASSPGTGAILLVGPYAISGTVLTPDRTPGTGLLNFSFPMRDATITRTDGKGDGVPIDAPRAIITRTFVQAAAVAGPPA